MGARPNTRAAWSGTAGGRQVAMGECDRVVDSRCPAWPSRPVASREAADPDLSRDYGKATQAALRLLSYRARSVAEVRRRLETSYPSAIIEQVLKRLVAQGYLDDAAFALEWRRSREEHRPRSRMALEHELLSMGVQREVVQEALSDYDGASNASRAALRLAQRLSDSDYQSFRPKVWRYLQRRGFEASVISDTVSRLWRELTDPHHRAVNAYPQEQQGEYGHSDRADAPADDEG